MKFHEHVTYYQEARWASGTSEKNSMPPRQWYAFLRENPGWLKPVKEMIVGSTEDYGALRSMLEDVWYGCDRQYYKVWPAMASVLMRLNLDFPGDSLDLDGTCMLVRFAEGHEAKHGDITLRSVLGYLGDVEGLEGRCLCAMATYMVPEKTTEQIQVTFIRLSPESIQKQLDRFANPSGRIDRGVPLKVLLTTMLLRKDPEFVKPDVLARHRDEFERTGDERLVKKAKEQGIVGWNVGKHFETIPHLRRPHLGIRWTGKGSTVPKVVPIRGAVVHRDRMTKVPTGHLDSADREVEVVS